MKKIIFSFIFFFLTFPSFCQLTWLPTNGPYSESISRVKADANGYLYAIFFHSGIFKSTDKGATWAAIHTGLPGRDITHFELNAAGTLFVIINYQDLYVSVNHGASWVLKRPLAPTGTLVTDIAAGAENTLFISLSKPGSTGDVIYSYDNGDNFFTAAPAGSNLSFYRLFSNNRGFCYGVSTTGVLHQIYPEPQWAPIDLQVYTETFEFCKTVQGVILGAGSLGTILRSMDDGETWEREGHPYNMLQYTVPACDTSGIFYLGSSEGVLKSTDYGNTWLRFNAGIENRSITGIAVATDGKVYCSAKFAGIYFSSDGCISWNNLSVSRQKATIIGFSVNAAGEIFAADQAGMLYKSTNTGCNWTIADKGITNQSTSEINRIIWQQDGKGLLVKEKSLFRTLNNGKDWVEIPLPEGMSYAFLCPGPGNSMYASAEGNLYQSTDFGTYWSQIKAPDYSDDNGFRIYSGQSGILLSINKNADIKRTEAGGMNWMSTFINGNVSGFDWGAGVVKESGTILFVVMHKGGILRSVNNGISWELVNNGIPSQYFYDLVVTKSGILYVATGSGVYRSTNNGDDWNAVNTGLPLGVVRSIIVGNDGYLFCGVDGQGIYKSAEPLRVENEMAVTKEKFTLEQNYPNPFNPATTITYNVPVSGSVTLVIFDVTGKEIARLVDGYKKAGSYSVQFSASNLVSGVYFYQLKANGCVETKKMTLIK